MATVGEVGTGTLLRRGVRCLAAAVVLLSIAGCGGGANKPSSSDASASGSGSTSVPGSGPGASTGGAPAVLVPSRALGVYASPTAGEAARFLHQTTFGALPEEITALTQDSLSNWIEQQFEAPQDFVLDKVKAEFAAAAAANRQGDGLGVYKAQIWEQMVRGKDQLRQRARYGLSQIFVVSNRTERLINRSYAMSSYFDLLGRDAFGNFRQLLGNVAMHPAMGLYLTYLGNDKEDAATGRLPDENFAREILQLFSIGLVQLNEDGTPKRDAKGQTIPTYDQKVVMGLAKVFTGWSWGGPDNGEARWRGAGWDWPEQETLAMQAYPSHHSPGPKQLLDGYVIPAGGTPESDLKTALDQIFQHPNVGPFIGYRLIQRLVTSNPSPAYVARVARAFADNGSGVRGDMRAVFRAVLLDPEARTAAAAQSASFGKLREPVQRYANMARIMRAQTAAGSLGIGDLSDPVWSLGQNPMMAPSVFNWYRPSYSPPGVLAASGLKGPEFQMMNESNAIGVHNLVGSSMMHGLTFRKEGPQVDLSRWIALADRPEALVDDLDLLFTGGVMSAATKQQILEVLRKYDGSPAGLRSRALVAAYLTTVSVDYLVQK